MSDFVADAVRRLAADPFDQGALMRLWAFQERHGASPAPVPAEFKAPDRRVWLLFDANGEAFFDNLEEAEDEAFQEGPHHVIEPGVIRRGLFWPDDPDAFGDGLRAINFTEDDIEASLRARGFRRAIPVCPSCHALIGGMRLDCGADTGRICPATTIAQAMLENGPASEPARTDWAIAHSREVARAYQPFIAEALDLGRMPPSFEQLAKQNVERERRIGAATMILEEES